MDRYIYIYIKVSGQGSASSSRVPLVCFALVEFSHFHGLLCTLPCHPIRVCGFATLPSNVKILGLVELVRPNQRHCALSLALTFSSSSSSACCSAITEFERDLVYVHAVLDLLFPVFDSERCEPASRYRAPSHRHRGGHKGGRGREPDSVGTCTEQAKWFCLFVLFGRFIACSTNIIPGIPNC